MTQKLPCFRRPAPPSPCALSTLPSFYGLLRAMLECDPERGCLEILRTHRNWEWAIKYLLIESQARDPPRCPTAAPALSRPPSHAAEHSLV